MSDQWFYQAFGEEHGPVSFDQLRDMASKHQLTPQHRVRSAENEDWQEARSLPQLFPHLQNADEEMTADEMDDLDFESLQVVSQEKQSEWSSLEELDIQVSDAPTQTKASSRSSDPYGSRWEDGTNPDNMGNGEPSADEEQWICDVLGVQLGPMPLEDLQVLARKGEIGLDDPVRRIDETAWQPAKTVEGLFPGFEFHSDVGLPEVAPLSPPPNEPLLSSLPTIGDDFDLAIDNLSSAEIPQAPADLNPTPEGPPSQPAPEPSVSEPSVQEVPAAKATSPDDQKRAELDKWLSDAVPSPPPKETETLSNPTESQPTAPPQPMEDRAAQLKAEFEARTAAPKSFTPPAPQKKVKSQSSGPGMGDQFSGLMEKLKGNPKILGVVIVLGLVFLLKYVPWPFGPSDQASLDTVKTIGNTFKEMRTRKASPSEFDAFKKESLGVIGPLKSKLLDAGAGINDRPKQELYWACGKLEKMLQAGLTGDTTKDEKDYDNHLAAAQALMNGEPPPPPPPVEGGGGAGVKAASGPDSN